MRYIVLAALLIVSFCCVARAQGPPRAVMIMMPFKADGVDPAAVSGAMEYLRSLINKGAVYYAIRPNEEQPARCDDFDCAMMVGENQGSAGVLYGRVGTDEDGMLLHYVLVDVKLKFVVDSADIRIGPADSLRPTMLALSTRFAEPTKAVFVGVGQQKEMEWESSSRLAHMISCSIGAFIPTNDDYSTFSTDLRYGVETKKMAIELMIGARSGFFSGISVSYIPVTWFITPYVGGGLGIQSMSLKTGEDSWGQPQYTDKLGLEARISAGIWVNHGGYHRLRINGDITTVLGSPHTGFVLTIGYTETSKRMR